MKFLVDVCAGRRLAEWLTSLGHDVQQVREHAPDMEDEEILRWAVREDRIVVTVDKDFGRPITTTDPAHACKICSHENRVIAQSDE